MAEYTVRHAVIQYSGKNAAGQDAYETAFRGMVVDLPDGAELDKLVAYGAVVPEGQQLVRPGTMRELPETATDAEIMNWVVGATATETEQLVIARPAMADRLLVAQESVKARFEEQAQHLSGKAQEARIKTVTTELITVSNSDQLSDEEADKVVNGPVKTVTDYVSENPSHAKAILEAENRRPDETRVSVVKAVQAAAAFSAGSQ